MVNKTIFFGKLHIWVDVAVVVIAIWEYLAARREKNFDNSSN